jgi:hypothetical protein
MPDHIINVPANFATTTMAWGSLLFSDLSTPIQMIIGVMLAVVVIEIIIHSIRPK